MKKNYYYGVVVLLTIISWATPAYSQSPYSISPDWFFGGGGAGGGRITFANGNFPVSPSPTTGSTEPTLVNGVETSTSICNPDGTIALYSSTMQAYNGNQVGGAWSTNLRDINNTDSRCAGSCTGGGVAIPNPAAGGGYYLIVGNDLTGGSCGSRGMNIYRFTGSGSSVAYAAGPTALAGAGAGVVVEGLTVGTDGTGGYWLITHLQTAANTFRVWHITAAGFSAFTDYTSGTATPASTSDQSYLKLSPCQDKIAFSVKNTVVVHSFDRSTGAVGTQLRYATGGSIPAGDGLEFSPDGNKLYMSGLGTAVQCMLISSGAVTPVAGGPTSWTMQLGPDGKLYTSNYTSSIVGVIQNLNGTASVGSNINIGSGMTFAGLINQAWLSPKTPAIPVPSISGCNATITFDFDNYFGTNVDVLAADVDWDFGDGTGIHNYTIKNPTYTFPASATAPKSYTVTVSFKDNFCGHTWTATRSVSINCPLPIELISFNGFAGDLGAVLKWQTATEKNNEYFDLQRSFDGVHFESVAHIKGAGNSSNILYYTYNDAFVTTGQVYYRLDQYDFDGTKSSSKIVIVQFERSNSTPFTLAPNPFSSLFAINKLYDEAATISVYDILGRLLEQKYSGPEEKTLLLGEELSNGSYIVKYVSQSSSYSLHIEKK